MRLAKYGQRKKPKVIDTDDARIAENARLLRGWHQRRPMKILAKEVNHGHQ